MGSYLVGTPPFPYFDICLTQMWKQPWELRVNVDGAVDVKLCAVTYRYPLVGSEPQRLSIFSQKFSTMCSTRKEE